MKVLALDASSNKSGIALFEDGKYIEHVLVDLHKNKNVMDRICQMVGQLVTYIHKFSPDLVLMEETLLNSNIDTVKKLAYMAGGVMCACHEAGIAFQFILPSEWRKKVGLEQSNKVKREMLKLESKMAVLKEYGLDVTDDESDAILIARSAFDLPKINVRMDDVDLTLLLTLD